MLLGQLGLIMVLATPAEQGPGIRVDNGPVPLHHNPPGEAQL